MAVFYHGADGAGHGRCGAINILLWVALAVVLDHTDDCGVRSTAQRGVSVMAINARAQCRSGFPITKAASANLIARFCGRLCPWLRACNEGRALGTGPPARRWPCLAMGPIARTLVVSLLAPRGGALDPAPARPASCGYLRCGVRHAEPELALAIESACTLISKWNSGHVAALCGVTLHMALI